MLMLLRFQIVEFCHILMFLFLLFVFTKLTCFSCPLDIFRIKYNKHGLFSMYQERWYFIILVSLTLVITERVPRNCSRLNHIPRSEPGRAKGRLKNDYNSLKHIFPQVVPWNTFYSIKYFRYTIKLLGIYLLFFIYVPAFYAE